MLCGHFPVVGNLNVTGAMKRFTTDVASTNEILPFPNREQLAIAAPCIGDQNSYYPARIGFGMLTALTGRSRHRFRYPVSLGRTWRDPCHHSSLRVGGVDGPKSSLFLGSLFGFAIGTGVPTRIHRMTLRAFSPVAKSCICHMNLLIIVSVLAAPSLSLLFEASRQNSAASHIKSTPPAESRVFTRLPLTIFAHHTNINSSPVPTAIACIMTFHHPGHRNLCK